MLPWAGIDAGPVLLIRSSDPRAGLCWWPGRVGKASPEEMVSYRGGFKVHDWDLYCLSTPGYMAKQAANITSCMMCLGNKNITPEISITPTRVCLSI